ncbi:hypothetical protein ACFPAF_16865 [Hymenobacter endophyticus]|uniref:Uncharacterized protein n=1 Tax=Hymenobacter endophyticus TaxID=3076335 RepID=A0ABU3TL17_9BACT|nr:hypothetical protein [Hymenobacter endophyticus]MDU0372076.1 hypothetical protein [Hymenobacter endophyticus]
MAPVIAPLVPLITQITTRLQARTGYRLVAKEHLLDGSGYFLIEYRDKPTFEIFLSREQMGWPVEAIVEHLAARTHNYYFGWAARTGRRTV